MLTKLVQKLNQIVMTTAVITSVGIASVTVLPQLNHSEITASAHAVQNDGPWEYTNEAHYEMLQHTYGADHEIYYSVKPGTRYGHYAESAAAAWNRLGVVKLVEVPWGDSASQITVSYINQYSPDSDSGESAETEFTRGMAPDVNNQIGYINIANIVLYKDMQESDSVSREVIVEHEFGHALGFAHDDRILNNGKKYESYEMTMNSSGDGDYTYRLGGIEQRTLAHHYGITPTYWLNSNC